MIGVSNHLLSKVFRFHYHSQKVIGSLGKKINYVKVGKYTIPMDPSWDWGKFLFEIPVTRYPPGHVKTSVAHSQAFFCSLAKGGKRKCGFKLNWTRKNAVSLGIFQHTPGTYPRPSTTCLCLRIPESFKGESGCLGILQRYVGVLLESRQDRGIWDTISTISISHMLHVRYMYPHFP